MKRCFSVLSLILFAATLALADALGSPPRSSKGDSSARAAPSRPQSRQAPSSQTPAPRLNLKDPCFDGTGFALKGRVFSRAVNHPK